MHSERAKFKNPKFLLALCIGMFLLVSLLMLWRYYFILPDSTYLLALGKSIVTGKGLTIGGGAHFRYPPAYGTVAGLLFLITGNLQASAHVISLLAGLGTIILVYYYTSNTYNRDAGVVAAALVALNPLFGRISSAALGESFFALGYAAFILIIFKLLKNPNWWLSFIAGLIASIVYLTRAEGFLILPLGFIILLIAWWRGKQGIGKIVLSLAMLVFGWMVLGFPYLLFLRENLGGWVLSGKITQNIERVSEAVFIDDFESLRDSSLKTHESPGLLPYIIQNFPRVAERYIFFTWQALSSAIIKAWPVIILFAWFIVLAIRKNSKIGWHYLAMASPLIVYPLAHIEIRYITPYFIVFAPVIGYGMHSAWISGGERDRGVKIRRALAVLTLVFMFTGCAYDIYTTTPPPYEHRILADWMAGNLEDARDVRLSSRFGYANFYLDNEDFRYLPKAETLEETIELAIERHVTYLIIDERLTPEVRPALEPLLDPGNALPVMELVVKLDPPDVPSTIILYRLPSTPPPARLQQQ